MHAVLRAAVGSGGGAQRAGPRALQAGGGRGSAVCRHLHHSRALLQDPHVSVCVSVSVSVSECVCE